MNKKKRDKLFDQVTIDQFVFRMWKLTTAFAISDFGVLMQGDRIKWDYLEHEGQKVIRAMLQIATQEEELCSYPADWWAAFKLRWFPVWLLKRYPAKEVQVMAVHKFPELNPPESVLGREFVHLKTIDMDKVQKKLEREEE